MSSRIEDLRDLARMLDEGKISQQEYEIVKSELLEAPAEEWLTGAMPSHPALPEAELHGDDLPGAETGWAGWLTNLREIPTTYRAGLVGAVLVLVVGGFIATRSDAAGTIAVVPRTQATTPAPPPADSLGLTLDALSAGWNAVEDPPSVSGGITTSPEPGPLDSFLYRFNDSAMLAGAYDPANGHVYALMIRANLHYESVSNLYVHLCYLLHPGSQACLDTFIEETGMFGRTTADLIGTERSATWAFEGHGWQFDIAADVETIRVQGNPESG